MPNNALQKGAAGTGQWPPPPFVAGQAVLAGDYRSVAVGGYAAYLRCNLNHTCAASFTVAEAARWDYQGQDQISNTWVGTGAVVPMGFIISINGTLVRNASNHAAAASPVSTAEFTLWAQLDARDFDQPGSNNAVKTGQPFLFQCAGVKTVATFDSPQNSTPSVVNEFLTNLSYVGQANVPGWFNTNWYFAGFKVTHADSLYEAVYTHAPAAAGDTPGTQPSRWRRLGPAGAAEAVNTYPGPFTVPGFETLSLVNNGTTQTVTFPVAGTADIGRKFTIKNIGPAAWNVAVPALHTVSGLSSIAPGRSVTVEVTAAGAYHPVAEFEDQPTSPTALAPWAPNENVPIYAERSMLIGGVTVGMMSNSARTTGATLNAGELSNWTYRSQSQTTGFPTNQMVPIGFKILADAGFGSLTYESINNRFTGASFDPAEQASWQQLSTPPSNIVIRDWTPLSTVKDQQLVIKDHNGSQLILRSTQNRSTNATFDSVEASFWKCIGQSSPIQFPWAIGTWFPVGCMVVDSGNRTWRCLFTNQDAEPFAGNSNWGLVSDARTKTASFGDQTASGVISPPALRWANFSQVRFNQTTAGMSVTFLPQSATDATVTRTWDIINVGSTSINVNGYSFAPNVPGSLTWDGAAWRAMMLNVTLGDVKQSMQTTDHNGWVYLDGRLRSTLTPTQQTLCTTLFGAGTNLPDSRNKVLMGSSGTRGVGTTGGSFTITQAQLPSVNLFGGNHSHGAAIGTRGYASGSNYGGYSNSGNFSGISSNDIYIYDSGTLTIPLGGSNQDHVPPYMAAGTFVYLGT